MKENLGKKIKMKNEETGFFSAENCLRPPQPSQRALLQGSSKTPDAGLVPLLFMTFRAAVAVPRQATFFQE